MERTIENVEACNTYTNLIVNLFVLRVDGPYIALTAFQHARFWITFWMMMLLYIHVSSQETDFDKYLDACQNERIVFSYNCTALSNGIIDDICEVSKSGVLVFVNDTAVDYISCKYEFYYGECDYFAILCKSKTSIFNELFLKELLFLLLFLMTLFIVPVIVFYIASLIDDEKRCYYKGMMLYDLLSQMGILCPLLYLIFFTAFTQIEVRETLSFSVMIYACVNVSHFISVLTNAPGMTNFPDLFFRENFLRISTVTEKLFWLGKLHMAKYIVLIVIMFCNIFEFSGVYKATLSAAFILVYGLVAHETIFHWLFKYDYLPNCFFVGIFNLTDAFFTIVIFNILLYYIDGVNEVQATVVMLVEVALIISAFVYKICVIMWF